MAVKIDYKKFLTSSPVQKTGSVRVDYAKFLPSQTTPTQVVLPSQPIESQAPTQIDLSKIKHGILANLPSAVGETISGFVEGLVSPFAKVGVGLYNVGAQIANPKTNQMIPRDIPFLGKTSPFLTGSEGLKEFTKKVIGSGLELAPYFVALPETKGILKILDKIGNKAVKDISAKEARQFIKAYAQKIAKSSATIGPTFGLGQSLQEDANLPETAKNILGSTITVATLETFLSPIMRQMFKSGGTKTVNESLKEFVESKEAPTLPALTAGEQPKLLGAPTVKATGEGFVMTEKADKGKVAEMKVRNTLTEAIKKYNKNPTETNLKTIQKLRAKFSEVLPEVPPEAPVVSKELPVTKQPEAVKPSVKTVEVPKEQLPVGTGKEKVSRLEARMKDMLGKLTEEERADLTLYRGVVKETQFAEGAAYVDKVGEDAALAVLEGKGVPPEGLLYSTIDIALRAKATDNAELALKLGTSRATRFGQEISMYRGQNEYHPVVAIQDIQLVRQKNLETRTRKTYDKLVEEEKSNITREINKTTKISPVKVTRENVMEFIDSIVC